MSGQAWKYSDQLDDMDLKMMKRDFFTYKIGMDYYGFSIDSIREEYEYILIDCAPSLGMMTINALVAADEVIIPVQAAYLPVKGLQQLIKTINMVKRRLNKKLQVGGILLAMVDYRTNYAKNISAQLYEAYGTNVGLFKTYVPLSVKAVEASSLGISIYRHDPKGKVAQAYAQVTEEVLYSEN